MDNKDRDLFFGVFNEIGIIQQLATTLLEARLPKGLIAPHFAVLNHLIRLGDGRTPKAIASAFQVPKTSMTHTIAVLERHGLVRVAPNPADGRSKLVWLTDAGRSVRDGTIAGMEPYFTLLSEEFDTDKLRQILPVLTELRRFLDENRLADAGIGNPARRSASEPMRPADSV